MGMLVASASEPTCAASSSSVTPPSRRPSVNAKAELVVASALKPSASKHPGRPGVPRVRDHERRRPRAARGTRSAFVAPAWSCLRRGRPQRTTLPRFPRTCCARRPRARRRARRRSRSQVAACLRRRARAIAMSWSRSGATMKEVGAGVRLLGDRHEPAAVAQHGRRAHEAIAAGGVEDQVNGIDRILEAGRRVVDHLVRAELPRGVHVGARHGRDHVGAAPRRELRGELADPAGGTVDQHALARLEAGRGRRAPATR